MYALLTLFLAFYLVLRGIGSETKKAAVWQRSRWHRLYMVIMFIGVLSFMIYLLAVPRISKDPVLTPVMPGRYTEPQSIMKAMLELEQHHRKMETNVSSLILLLESKLQEAGVGLTNEIHAVANITSTKKRIQNIKTNLDNLGIKIKGYVSSYLRDLKAADSIVALWRERESRELVHVVQKMIHKVMNPANCEQKKKFFSATLTLDGIQVRRTDKLLREAKAFDIREYMKKVDEYFDKQELKGKVEKRRVYIATDEPKVITEARKLYPKYDILHDQTTVSGAGVKARYSAEGLKAIVTDLEILSACDYVVCTFSSNICRAVYEYMQAKHLDASENCHSLDKGYYFG